MLKLVSSDHGLKEQGKPTDSEKEEFTPIPPESVADGTARSFSLYLRRGGKFVLYRSGDYPVGPKDLERLAENGIKVLWIRSRDRKAYLRHLESNLSKMLSDENVPVKKRSKLLYEVSKEVVHDLFDDPAEPANLLRAQDLAENQVNFLEREPSAFISILGLTSHHYYTFTHSIHVSVYSTALAVKHSTLPEEKTRELALAGLLHDLGKTLISKEILDKPSKLDPKEWLEIKRHPTNGKELAKQGGIVTPDILAAIEQHHEKFKGGGYPRGIGGQEIQTMARYISVADVFDAMTTKRAYDRRYGTFEALKKMVTMMKDNFDPEILKLFITLLGEPVIGSTGRKAESGGAL